jgi:hypothetical protein
VVKTDRIFVLLLLVYIFPVIFPKPTRYFVIFLSVLVAPTGNFEFPVVGLFYPVVAGAA